MDKYFISYGYSYISSQILSDSLIQENPCKDVKSKEKHFSSEVRVQVANGRPTC